MTTQHYQDLRQEVNQTITELNEDSKNLKAVHKGLSEIEPAKDGISTCSIAVMNEEDQCGVNLKVWVSRGSKRERSYTYFLGILALNLGLLELDISCAHTVLDFS